MNKYVLLLSAIDLQAMSPAELEEAYGKFRSWMEKLRAEGRLEGGEQLERNGARLTANTAGLVSDGPYVETKEAVGGFFSILANDLNEAVSVAKGCPSLGYGGAVEVRPVVNRER